MIVKDQVQRILIVAPSCQPQVWYQTILRMSLGKYVPSPHHAHLLLNHQGQMHPLIAKNYNRSCLYSFTFKVLGEGISQRASKHVQVKGEKVHYEITIFLCQITLIDVVKEIWFILMHYRQSFVLFRLLVWSIFWVKNNWLTVIYVYYDYVGNKPVGELPYVCDLLKGMFTHRPP